MRKLTFRFEMSFEMPPRLSCGDRKTIRRLVQASEEMKRLASGDGVLADRGHLRDAVDAVELLVSVGKRAKAST